MASFDSTPARTTPNSFSAALRREWPASGSAVLTALLASLTLGLAPFYPHAHVWKQLVNLAQGTLTAPMDVFDLVLHGAPWVALIVAISRWLWRARSLPKVSA